MPRYEISLSEELRRIDRIVDELDVGEELLDYGIPDEDVDTIYFEKEFCRDFKIKNRSQLNEN